MKKSELTQKAERLIEESNAKMKEAMDKEQHAEAAKQVLRNMGGAVMLFGGALKDFAQYITRK